MIEAVIVCEGQTEESFVKNVLHPNLAPRGVFVQPRLITTSRHSQGGGLTRGRVLRSLQNILRERQGVYVTTFFDLYGLVPNFPGKAGSDSKADPLERAAVIETGLHKDIIEKTDCLPDRFFPHIQPHEFEALLFSDTKIFVEVEPEWRKFSDKLLEISTEASSPEHINDGPQTHPSARLNILVPRFRKTAHGWRLVEKIGLECIRAECRHFGQWLTRLENLPPL